MSEWVPVGVLFGAVFLGCFLVLQGVAWRRQRELRRLQAQAEAAALDSTPEMILGEPTPVLAETFPVMGEKRDEINQELIRAGYYRANALVNYAALRFVLVVVPLLLAGVMALFVDQRYVVWTAIAGLVLAALGYSLPRVYVRMRGAARQREVASGLPVAVDLLALGLMSGQDVLTALRRVTEEIKHAFPTLAGELSLVRRQTEMNTLPHALAQFADRIDLAEVRNLVIILSQSQRQGTDVASALMEFVNNFRISLRQEADKRANQASFWLVFPSIFLLWLPAFALLMAPITFEMSKKRDETVEQTKKGREELQKILNNQGKGRPPMNAGGSSGPDI